MSRRNRMRGVNNQAPKKEQSQKEAAQAVTDFVSLIAEGSMLKQQIADSESRLEEIYDLLRQLDGSPPDNEEPDDGQNAFNTDYNNAGEA